MAISTTSETIPNEVQLEEVPCPLGCPPSDEVLLTASDRLHKRPGLFNLVRCTACDLIRTNPRPTPETIGFYYPEQYAPYSTTHVRTQVRLSPLQKLIRFLFNTNSQRIPNREPGRMLEVGCAAGGYMHSLAAKGWQVEGIEFSSTAAANARALGYSVHTTQVEQAPNPEHAYDLIVAWMVVEHLHDPVKVLQRMCSWVKEDGRLVFSVPNCASLEFRLFQQDWYALELPRHLYTFTPKSIEKVLAASGWELERIFHQRSVGNLIGSLGYKLERSRRCSWLSEALIQYPSRSKYSHYLLHPLAFLLACFGQTGRMTIWAKRK